MAFEINRHHFTREQEEEEEYKTKYSILLKIKSSMNRHQLEKYFALQEKKCLRLWIAVTPLRVKTFQTFKERKQSHCRNH